MYRKKTDRPKNAFNGGGRNSNLGAQIVGNKNKVNIFFTY